MKCKTLLTFLLFTTSLCNAQNLVPNPSFEEHEYCPTGMTHLNNSVVDWYSWQESPDYFHSCNNDLSGTAGVPGNAWGFQYPITGEAYAGLFTYVHSFANGREYIACPLSESLEIGEHYYVMFYASLYDGGEIDHVHCAVDKLGAKFFQDPDYTPEIWDNPYLPENTADIEYNEMFTDSVNWVLIDGWFTADQAYNWLALGNFYDDENTDTLQMGDPGKCYAFYYIENVCVATDPADCDYLKQEGDISSVTEPNSTSPHIQIYPNPVTDFLNLNSSTILTDLKIFNPIGQLIAVYKPHSTTFSIQTTHWSKGLYILKVVDENNHQQTFKITKQ